MATAIIREPIIKNTESFMYDCATSAAGAIWKDTSKTAISSAVAGSGIGSVIINMMVIMAKIKVL